MTCSHQTRSLGSAYTKNVGAARARPQTHFWSIYSAQGTCLRLSCKCLYLPLSRGRQQTALPQIQLARFAKSLQGGKREGKDGKSKAMKRTEGMVEKALRNKFLVTPLLTICEKRHDANRS